MENDSEETEKLSLSSSKEPAKTNPRDSPAMEKAVRFWTHPSLANVPAETKIEYLRSRGLSLKDIHHMWEQLVEQDNVTPSNAAVPAANNSSTTDSTGQQQRGAPLPPPPQQPNYPQQYYSDPQSEDVASAMDIPALMAIGGALGVTAAAAVRWLNGGDFMLFPPPTQGGTTVRTTENDCGVRSREVDHNDDNVNEDDDEDGEEESFVEVDRDEMVVQQKESFLEAMQQVLELLETQSSQQERILQQLSNYTTKQVTDESMSLLRNHNKVNNIPQEVAEIKTQLQTISESSLNVDNEELERKLEECLTQLQDCMKVLVAQGTAQTQVAATSQHSKTPSEPPPFSRSAFEPTTTTLTSTAPMENSKSLLLREAIRMLAEENDPSALRAGAQLLYLYVINLSSHPHVPRYQKIFTTNESFQKVQDLKGGTDLLVAVGFEAKGNCLEWQGGDTLYLKEAAAALSILKSCNDDTTRLSSNALSVLRPSTPPPVSVPASALQTPVFIASPPVPKKHPLLDDSGDDSVLNISNASEHFESRLESLSQPVMDNVRMYDGNVYSRNLPMRESNSGDETSGEDGGSKYESSSQTFDTASNGDGVDISGQGEKEESKAV